MSKPIVDIDLHGLFQDETIKVIDKALKAADPNKRKYLRYMTNLITKTTELAMTITLEYVKNGDIVIDATCGTGQDTIPLARAVGETGKVYAFDIQQDAIDRTRCRLGEEGVSNVQFVCDSFVTLGDYVPEESASAVVFNLGYLPGGDHSITTTAEETIKGLEVALKTVKPGGIVTAVMYDGHTNGAEEKRRVLEWAKDLDSSKYHAAYVNMLNQPNNPPEIIWITKKG